MRGYKITEHGTVITLIIALLACRRDRVGENRKHGAFGISSASDPGAFPDFVGTDRSEFSNVVLLDISDLISRSRPISKCH